MMEKTGKKFIADRINDSDINSINDYIKVGVIRMSKYNKYFLQNPIDYGENRYYEAGYYGPNVWYKGADYNTNFTMCFVRVEESMVMEEDSHTHDFDMYIWFLPADPRDMEDLGCEIEYFIGSGEEQERFIVTKTSSFYCPKGIFHGPLTFKNVTKPVYLVHATMAEDYKTWRDMKDS